MFENSQPMMYSDANAYNHHREKKKRRRCRVSAVAMVILACIAVPALIMSMYNTSYNKLHSSHGVSQARTDHSGQIGKLQSESELHHENTKTMNESIYEHRSSLQGAVEASKKHLLDKLSEVNDTMIARDEQNAADLRDAIAAVEEKNQRRKLEVQELKLQLTQIKDVLSDLEEQVKERDQNSNSARSEAEPSIKNTNTKNSEAVNDASIKAPAICTILIATISYVLL